MLLCAADRDWLGVDQLCVCMFACIVTNAPLCQCLPHVFLLPHLSFFSFSLLLCAAPSASPTQLSADSNSPRSVSVFWNPPPVSEQNGFIVGYLLIYKCLEWADCNVTMQKRIKTTNITLTNLHPYTTYYFIVSALTAAGEGPRSQTYFRTLPDSELSVFCVSSWSLHQTRIVLFFTVRWCLVVLQQFGFLSIHNKYFPSVNINTIFTLLTLIIIKL